MSKTTIERLVYMANQIATNLATTPDPAAGTAAHIARYWDPRMKTMILAGPHDDLSPVAAAAIAQLKA